MPDLLVISYFVDLNYTWYPTLWIWILHVISYFVSCSWNIITCDVCTLFHVCGPELHVIFYFVSCLWTPDYMWCSTLFRVSGPELDLVCLMFVDPITCDILLSIRLITTWTQMLNLVRTSSSHDLSPLYFPNTHFLQQGWLEGDSSRNRANCGSFKKLCHFQPTTCVKL